VENQQKQKLMLAGLAVAAIAAGSYYYFTSGGDDLGQLARKGGPTVKKDVAGGDKDETKTVRKTTDKAPGTAKGETVKKSDNTPSDARKSVKRGTPGEKIQVKKKGPSPAA
jgi:hypothetical protein